jgi:hypothetical protein
VQTHGGPEADAAIRAAERQVGIYVKVDWNGNGLYDHPLSDLADYVESISTDRALSGSAPEEIMLVEGTSVAELRMTLSGSYLGQTLASQFSPFNHHSVMNGSQLAGCEILYSIWVDTSVGRVEYPQFVGQIRTVTPRGLGPTKSV